MGIKHSLALLSVILILSISQCISLSLCKNQLPTISIQSHLLTSKRRDYKYWLNVLTNSFVNQCKYPTTNNDGQNLLRNCYKLSNALISKACIYCKQYNIVIWSYMFQHSRNRRSYVHSHSNYCTSFCLSLSTDSS